MYGKVRKCILLFGILVFVMALNTSVGVCSQEGFFSEDDLEIGKLSFITEDGEDLILPHNIILTGDMKLQQNTIIEGNLTMCYGRLDINGKKLTIKGDLLQKGGTVFVNAGDIEIEGNYIIGKNGTSVNASLEMTNILDYVKVHGSFVMNSNISHKGKLSGGTMEIKGDFTQKGGSPESFYASGSHSVILNGKGNQTIEFENRKKSRFYILCIDRPLEKRYNFINDQDVWMILKELYEKSMLEVSVAGDGYVILNDNEILPDNYKHSFEIEKNIKLEAEAGVGSEFSYWEDIEIKRIISLNPIFNFVLGTGANLKAVFNETVTEEFNVVFLDRSKKILQSTKVLKNQAAIPPADPRLIGYEFVGWNKDFSNVTSNMTISPIFQRLSDEYSVNVVNGTLMSGNTVGQYLFDVEVQVIADVIDQMIFSHWEMDGLKISIDNTYTFFMPKKDITLTAVFVDEEEVVEYSPFIALSNDVLVDNDGKTVMFTATRNMVEGYSLIESGVILLKSDTDPEDEITLDTQNIVKGRINNDSTNQFYIRKINVLDGEIWYGRGYLIYRDLNGNIITVYSEITAKAEMGGE
ncbi:UNVERIFIED_CONTAM: hypothetical protein Cloal_2447 [Acetivibrio alkalicellulosi]